MPTAPIRFEKIPISEVPSHSPVAQIPGSKRGSQWDEVLRVLQREYGVSAVKIKETDRQKRNKCKSTLQTMAKNRGLFVEVRDDGDYIYAWLTDRDGRFSPPKD